MDDCCCTWKVRPSGAIGWSDTTTRRTAYGSCLGRRPAASRSSPYPDSVDEALCFGWIDSRTNRLDGARAMRLFTPRRAKSPWSRINKARVARLTAQGQMAPGRPAGGRVSQGERVVDRIRRDRGPDRADRFGRRTRRQRGCRDLLRALPRFVEEEHPLVDQVGTEAGDAVRGASPRRSRWLPRIAWPTIPRAAIEARSGARASAYTLESRRRPPDPPQQYRHGNPPRETTAKDRSSAGPFRAGGPGAGGVRREHARTARVSGASGLDHCRAGASRTGATPYPPRRRRRSRPQRRLRPQPRSRRRRRPRPP